jgi:hypothetical protein
MGSLMLPDRNAIGAYGGPYSIYRGLAVAMGDLPYNVSVHVRFPAVFVISTQYQRSGFGWHWDTF